MPDADAASSQHLDSSQTQFNPDRDGELYEVVEILAERGKKYLVKWAGIDESTGKPWKDTWVFKTDTTDDLTREWKLKKHATNKRRKSGATKTGGSSTSSKTQRHVVSTPSTSTTRRTRLSVAGASATPSSTRLPLNASSSRASPAAQPDNSPTTRKRRRDLRASHPMVVEVPTPEPSRPRKKRKLEVEVVQPPSRHPSEEPQSDDEVVGRKRSGKTAVRRMQDADEDSNASPRPGGSLDRVRPPSAAGRRRTAKAADHEDEVEDEEEHAEYAVPTTKVGPPRHLKRRRQTVPTPQTSPEMVPISPIPVRQPRRAKRIARPPEKQCSASPGHTSNPKPSAPSTLSNGAKGKGLLKSNSLPRGLTGSKRPSLESSSGSDGAEEEEASRLFKALNVPSSRPSYLTLKARQSLMQEEEENTQEAAGIVPSSPPNPSLSPLLPEPEPEPEQESESEGPRPTLGPGPYRLGQRHGRPFANDTFSRLGIVPETQATKAQEALDEAPYDPSQHDLVSDFDVLRTPVRRSKGSSSRPGSVSLISKMKNKRKGKSKELLPIPQLSPSAFRPYLPQEDEIEDFSSPEKDKRRPRREAEPFTQDTIEDFSQDADMDHFMDWEGGQQPAELLASVHENGPDLSLGPELTPPDAEGGPRKVMGQLLSKEDARRDVPVSPEIPPLPEFPLTSTTQQAEVDSMSQQPSIRSSQIAELNAVLEEKDEKLTQLESQVEELQTRIAELESENAEGRATLEIELETLRADSGEKAEQITQLENQLVELQLQLTQLTADNENQRVKHESQIRNLNESLEERNEQVSQLEGALVELQVEVEAIEAEKEKLEMAKHQHSTEREHDAHDQEQLTALQQRLSALEDELARAQQQHEETIASLTQRLEITSQEHEGRFKGIEDDRDLFRKLYDDASTHAQRLARENAELEEGRQRAEGRAQAGVAMVKATFTAQVAALKAEVERLTALVKVLNDKDARTDDDVRARAAREPELQEENAVLRRDNMELRRKVEQMLIIGTAAKWADDDREDEDYVPDGEDGGSPSSSPSSDSSDSDNDSDGRASPVSVRAPASHSSLPDRGFFFVCQHVSGEHMCNKTFADAQGVIEHANNIHYHDVQRPDF